MALGETLSKQCVVPKVLVFVSQLTTRIYDTIYKCELYNNKPKVLLPNALFCHCELLHFASYYNIQWDNDAIILFNLY